MTSSIKWDFSPLQPFPRDMPAISHTPLHNNSWQIATFIFFLSSEKWLYLGKKKNYEYDTKWIVFVPGGTADKKLVGIHRNCFFISPNVFFTFVHPSMPFTGAGDGGEAIVIQLLNFKFNLWTLQHPYSRELRSKKKKNKTLKQNRGEITVCERC